MPDRKPIIQSDKIGKNKKIYLKNSAEAAGKRSGGETGTSGKQWLGQWLD